MPLLCQALCMRSERRLGPASQTLQAQCCRPSANVRFGEAASRYRCRLERPVWADFVEKGCLIGWTAADSLSSDHEKGGGDDGFKAGRAGRLVL